MDAIGSYDYLTHVENAISRGDVETLVVFWAQSATHRGGREIHQLITDSIPKLALDNHILYDGDSFREFITIYDKIVLDRTCGAPENCLAYFAELGHKKGVLRALERGAKNYGEAIITATSSGRLAVIRDILWSHYEEKDDKYILRDFMISAVKSGDLPTVAFFTDKVVEESSDEYIAPEIELGLQEAVRRNKKEIVKYLLERVKEENATTVYYATFFELLEYTLNTLLRISRTKSISTYLRNEIRKVSEEMKKKRR